MAKPLPSPKGYIEFPKEWNDSWVPRSDFKNATSILVDSFQNNEVEGRAREALRGVLNVSRRGGYLREVTYLARDVQLKVFRNQHLFFGTNRLVQRMRFILLKSQRKFLQHPDTNDLIDFFFDVAIPTNPHLTKTLRSEQVVALELPDSRLKVVIIGGGPTGLSAAINLAERVKSRRLVQIHVYDKRWTSHSFGELHFTSCSEDERRRDQVITLQDHVKDLLSSETKNLLEYGLGNRGAEHVWPDSSNLQIRKVEDALLKRAQDSVFDGIIYLHGADIKDEAALVREAGDDFHLLLATDGANSWIRDQYFAREKEHCGRSLALGVAIDRGNKTLPHPQALDIFLSLCQTRYLLNASYRDGVGYMNMILTEQEYDQCVRPDGLPADCHSPAGILKDVMKSKLGKSIHDGLRLFGFEKKDAKSVARIPIDLIAVSATTKIVRLGSERTRRPHCLMSLAGDSALTHHFWAGRGMNSGIKAAIAWSDQVANLIIERNEGFVGLDPLALRPFEDFMKALRDREHTHRSFVIQNTSGLPERMREHLNQARKLSDPSREVDAALSKRVLGFAERLEGRRGWQHEKMRDLDGQVSKILAKLSRKSKAEMYHSGPWPTDKMSGAEVLPPEQQAATFHYGWKVTLPK